MPQGPLAGVQQHIVEHLADLAPMVQILDVPVLQKGEELAEILKLVDTQSPVEQVVAVPKISNFSTQPRSVLRCPQMAEQLVEVPTVVSFAVLQQHTTEQIFDISVPGRVVVDGEVFQAFPQNRIQQHGWWSRTLTFKFLVVVVVREVFQVLTQDRVQQLGFRSRSLTFLFVPLEVRTSLILELQALPQFRVERLGMGVFALFP